MVDFFDPFYLKILAEPQKELSRNLDDQNYSLRFTVQKSSIIVAADTNPARGNYQDVHENIMQRTRERQRPSSSEINNFDQRRARAEEHLHPLANIQIYRTRGPGIFYTEAQRGWQQDLEARFSIFEKKKIFLILKKVKKVRLFYLKNLQPFGRKTVHGGRRTVDGVRWTGEGGRWTVDGERRTVNVKRRTAYGRRRTGKTDGVRWTADSGRRTVDGGRGRRTVGARYGFYTLWNVNHEMSGVDRNIRPRREAISTLKCTGVVDIGE
ncbi:unnamed protein product, partial [Nesidiocoris tenuis]